MTEEQIQNSIRRDRNPHAILLSGPEGAGKRELARRLAALYCTGEPEVLRLETEPNYVERGPDPILIKDMRALLDSARLVGFNGGRRAFVFIDAHRTSELVQNTLLKIIEEPPKDTLFLLTGSESGILQTIRSRCAVVRFGSGDLRLVEKELVSEGAAPEAAAVAAARADGVLGLARRFSGEESRRLSEEAAGYLETLLFSAPPILEIAKTFSAEKDPAAALNRCEGILTEWELILRDALAEKADAGFFRCPDRRRLVARIAKSFTFRAVQGMIDKVTEAQIRLFYRPNAAYTMDAAVVGLSEYKEKTR